MLAATTLAIFVVPVLFVLITKISYGKKLRISKTTKEEENVDRSILPEYNVNLVIFIYARRGYKYDSLAVPIIIGELAQMALHIIDSAMVGAISYKQFAATSLVISAMNIPFVFGIGMTISVSQMVSMAHGRSDAQLVSHYFFNGFFLCALTAVIISFDGVWNEIFLILDRILKWWNFAFLL